MTEEQREIQAQHFLERGSPAHAAAGIGAGAIQRTALGCTGRPDEIRSKRVMSRRLQMCILALHVACQHQQECFIVAHEAGPHACANMRTSR